MSETIPPKPPTHWVCTFCGGTDVWRDAWVNVNNSDDVDTFDDTFCKDCDGECNIEEKAIE